MKYLELFPACVQTHQTELDIDSLISFCYTLQRKHNKGIELSNLGGWQSGNIKNNPHPEFVKLLSVIQFATKIYHNKLQFKKEFKQENIFSYVPQEIFLLDDTLRKNIAFGDYDKEIRDENVYDAIKSSGLSSFVEKNKKGLKLIVGERGIRLSGGEKQRVGIARALYRKPDILILDEATSSLDYVTEKDIISSIDKLKKQLTIVIVSHRLSTIENCDKVFLISNGKIKDSGKLDYLRSKHPEDFLRTN